MWDMKMNYRKEEEHLHLLKIMMEMRMYLSEKEMKKENKATSNIILKQKGRM